MPSNLQWKVVASIGRTVTTPAGVGTLAFEAQPSPRLYLQLGVPVINSYVPLVLEPTATLHQLLRNKLEILGHHQTAKKPPFQLTIPGLGVCPFHMRVRLYAPNIVVVTFRLDIKSDMNIESDFADLVSWRSLDTLEVIKNICQLVIGVIDSGSHKHPTGGIRFRTLPACHLTLPANSDALPQFVDQKQRFIAALLLGVKRPQGMSLSLIDSALKLNEELNKKLENEALLLNKQGVLHLTPNDVPENSYADRFGRMTNLVEIGFVFQKFLSEYRGIRKCAEDFADYIFMRIREWLDHPAAIFAESYTNRLAWEVIAHEFQLREKLAIIAGNPAVAEVIIAKREALESVADNWWDKPEFAQVFDDALANYSQVLGRITDLVLRQSILLDIREAERAFDSKSFKSAVIMSGAAVEAMMLALLKQETNETGLEGPHMGLHQYLDLAKTHNLIRDIGMVEMLDNSLRDWRNLVHPGKVQRTGVSITGDHAKIAIAAMNSLAKSLK